MDQNLPTRIPTYPSAWSDEHTISIAGKAVEEKSNEITAIPNVLDSIDLTRAVVSIDAMGTQTDIAQNIVESEADYVLALKRNHRHSAEDLKKMLLPVAIRSLHTALWARIMGG